jgi:hypothetical protein
MPYIPCEQRIHIEHACADFTPQDGGELQYAIAMMIAKFYDEVESNEGGVRYKHMEQMMGALSGALNEHYRCVVAPYEDKKIKENGGVYNVKEGRRYYNIGGEY